MKSGDRKQNETKQTERVRTKWPLSKLWCAVACLKAYTIGAPRAASNTSRTERPFLAASIVPTVRRACWCACASRGQHCNTQLWASARNDSRRLWRLSFWAAGTFLKPSDEPQDRLRAVSSSYRSQQHTKDADRERLLRFLNTKESKWVEQTCERTLKVHVLLRAAFVSNKWALQTQQRRPTVLFRFGLTRSETTDAHLRWLKLILLLCRNEKNKMVLWWSNIFPA